jgi:3-dehydroquinate synthase/shikimate kinase/3-dehydroquinate synthase
MIGENIIEKTGNLISTQIPNCKKIALIIDNKVPKKILTQVKNSIKNFDNLYIKLNTSEKIKNFKIVGKLINKLLKKNFHRNDCLIALGGGVLGDIAGLIASLVKRGIKFINIPTTLLSQVDSSVGGKTGVNSRYGKNLIGSFYQPEMVISDTSTLSSLPKREVVCGYAEILKHALILDKKLFFWLQKNGKKILNLNNKVVIQRAIYQSCKIKAKIVEKDEKEKGLRKILNFGHTFGHAFEATTNFSNKINHGESVLLGMLCASEFAYRNKILKNKDLNLIKEHYSILNLPNKLDDYFTKKDVKNIIQFMKSDKKNFDSKIKLILINKIGKTLKSISLKNSVLKNYLSSKLF